MSLFIKKFIALVGMTLCIIGENYCQIVTSTKNGLWTDPTVWDSGQVPSVTTATEVIVNHDVIIPAGTTTPIQNVVVNGMVTLEPSSSVDLVPDGLPAKPDLQVFGRLVMSDAATLNGTSISNTRFESGARYTHLQGPLGFIPYATWDKNSTFEIAGFKAQGYINIAHSDSWKQTFGNVVYNCPQQTTAFVDLNGYLRNISGNFIVQNTNNQALRLSTTQNPVITIGEDFIVEGPSKVWLSTAPANTVVNIRNNFRYRSRSTGISYLTTKGTIVITIGGDMEMDSPGRIHMASTSTDSTGARLATLTLKNHLSVVSGSILGPPNPGRGKINFTGSTVQNVYVVPVNAFQGNIDFTVDNGSIVNLGTSALTSSGDLFVKGKLQVGSSDPGGAIQLINKGNIQVQGSRTFSPGCTIEYNGLAEQWIGPGHPSSPDVNFICTNSHGTSLLKEIVANDVNIQGKFTSSFLFTTHGNISVTQGTDCSIQQINLSGGKEQYISCSGITMENLIVSKTGNVVRLISPLNIKGTVAIESPNTLLYANGNLTLLSSSDEPLGTAGVGPLPSGSFILGDVNVHRHMAGEGRIYRYISSPVQNATVASLQDDFPVTGRFLDPTLGFTTPSLYYYDESIGSLQAGWLPYPTSGPANNNPLMVGKGYAAFIRNGVSPTIWDVTGPLNQGVIDLPLQYSPGKPSNGWNLVGNPYASAIRWDEGGENGWIMENISSVIAIRDNGNAGGAFRYWDMDENYAALSAGQIASCQSFWVRATGLNPRLTIREGAKASGGAEFFRKETSVISSFAIEMSKAGSSDVAYYKIRPSATRNIDPWDGIKLDNENFDISIVGSDQNSFAIHATNLFPCDTTIQIGLKDLTPGTYFLRVTTKHDFLRYEFTVVDQFLHTEMRLIEGETLTLSVTSNPASYAYDRISLRVREREPEVDVKIVGPPAACRGSVVKLTVEEREPNIGYSWWEGETFLQENRPDQNGDVQLLLFTDSLDVGNHIFQLKAHSACHVKAIPTEYVLALEAAPRVWADSAVICPGDSAVVRAYCDRQDVTFIWSSDRTFSDTLASGEILKTPSLTQSQRYAVQALTSYGCKSVPITVEAIVKTHAAAQISLVEATKLVSNFRSGNTWFFNGKKMEDTGPTVLLSLPGHYTLQVDTMGCLSEDSFEYNAQHLASGLRELSLYPNPMGEKLFVRHGLNEVIRLELINSQGTIAIQKADNASIFSVDVSQLASGLYVAVVTTLAGKRIFRLLKDGP